MNRLADVGRGVLVLALARPRRKHRPGTARRILFLRSAPIGDALVALGALKALADAHPGAVIDVIGARELTEAFSGLRFIGRVITVDRADRWAFFRAAARVWRERPYDVVIDGYTGAGPIGVSRAFVIAAARAPVRIGGATGISRRIFTHPVDLKGPFDHMVANAYALITPLVSPPPQHVGPEFHLHDAERAAATRRWLEVPGCGPRVLINIAAGHASRDWSLDNYARVLSRLRAGLPRSPIAIIGHGRPVEAALLAERFDGRVIHTTFREMMALVATSDLVISPDTSVIHVAAAFQRVVISIHPFNKERWRPWQARGRAVFGSSGFTLDSVSVADVVAALDEVLATETDLRPE